MHRIVIPAFLCIFLFCAALPLHGQRPGKVTVTSGDEHKKGKKHGVEAIHLVGDEGVYLQRKKSILGIQAFPIPNMEYYEASMKRKATRDFDLKYQKRDRYAEGVVSIGEKIYIFTTLYNKETKNRDMFVQEVGGSRISSLESMQKVAEMPGDHTTVRGRYDLKISEDGSHLLIFSRLPRHMKASDSYAFRVFDKNMSLVWEYDADLPFDADRFSIVSHQVDNDGNVYLLGKYVDERATGLIKFATSYQYVVLAYGANSKTPQTYTLKDDDKHITTLGFSLTDDGNLTCSGFYSDASTVGGIKGVFFARIDPYEKRVYDRSFQPFDFDFITEGYSNWQLRQAEKVERDPKRKGAELTHYVFRELIPHDDGSVTLVAEQHYVVSSSSLDNRTRSTSYHYNDIIAIRIDADGNVKWTSRIPKLQQTQNDNGRYSSFAMGVRDDYLYFAYNDHHVNHQAGSKPDKRRSFKGRNSVMVVTEVRPDGSTREYSVGDVAKGKGKYRIEPSISLQTSDNTVAVYTSRKRRYKMARINLPK